MTKIEISFIALLVLNPLTSHASTVVVSQSTNSCQLTVDGQPIFVKGVGCTDAVGSKNEDYLLMAKQMGANSVRTWGITGPEYFDKVRRYGLSVDAGVWFNPIRSGMSESYEDPAYRHRLKEETLAYVRKMKGHPALLFWNLGNEVFTFTESEREKKAFGLFLEDLVQAVKREDPNHPTVFACSGQIDLEGLKTYVPSLDIVGLNNYGGYRATLQWLKASGYNKPLLVTEYGPSGEWDQQKDINGQPYDPYDQFKAHEYAERWREIEQSTNVCLGGYAFVLGEPRNQGSLTYWNLNIEDKKREGYWTLAALYTGHPLGFTCPRIRLLQIDRVKDLSPGETIYLDISITSNGNRPCHFSYFMTDIATDQVNVAPAHIFPAHAKESAPGQAAVRAPTSPGAFRVYVVVEDDLGNAAVANRSIFVKS